MAGKRTRLTHVSVSRLAPSKREYTVWDTRQPGLGVRVRPSGHRSFVYLCEAGNRTRRITIGPTALIGVEEAREKCRALETEAGRSKVGRDAPPTFAEYVEGPGQVCLARCKLSTQKGKRSNLNRCLLPAFGATRLDRITRTAVQAWFDSYSQTAPGGANSALYTFRSLLNHAIACGFIDANPTKGVRPNPMPKRTRFLSQEELTRLHDALASHSEGARPSVAQQADIIRLLLFTGCRRSEIVSLRWQEVGADALHLADSKTGPRSIPLNAPARAILNHIVRGGSAFVFPSPIDPARPRSGELSLWDKVRLQAGIEEVRLHDLRHTHASHAVLQGVPLPVVARLLGHTQPSMTLRYAHVGDRETEAAAERVGKAITRLLDGPEVNATNVD